MAGTRYSDQYIYMPLAGVVKFNFVPRLYETLNIESNSK